MGLANFIKRSCQSLTPKDDRAAGGVFVTYLPHGVGPLGIAATTLTAATGVAFKYGPTVTVLAATANPTDSWVEGFSVTNPNGAQDNWMIAVLSQIVPGAAGAITANMVLGEAPCYLETITADGTFIPLAQRVWIPAGLPITLAVGCSVAGQTLDAWVVISRQK